MQARLVLNTVRSTIRDSMRSEWWTDIRTGTRTSNRSAARSTPRSTGRKPDCAFDLLPPCQHRSRQRFSVAGIDFVAHLDDYADSREDDLADHHRVRMPIRISVRVSVRISVRIQNRRLLREVFRMVFRTAFRTAFRDVFRIGPISADSLNGTWVTGHPGGLRMPMLLNKRLPRCIFSGQRHRWNPMHRQRRTPHRLPHHHSPRQKRQPSPRKRKLCHRRQRNPSKLCLFVHHRNLDRHRIKIRPPRQRERIPAQSAPARIVIRAVDRMRGAALVPHPPCVALPSSVRSGSGCTGAATGPGHGSPSQEASRGAACGPPSRRPTTCRP